MSAMLYTHTAEPRKMELGAKSETYVNKLTDRFYDGEMLSKQTWRL